MINPADLNLSSLPWLPLEARSSFPRQPAIYFAIDSQNNVQYVGRSINPKQRWTQHHRYEDLTAIGQVRIAYLFVEAIELLPAIEAALIDWFDPPLNCLKRPNHASDLDGGRKMICRLPVLIDEYNIRLSEANSTESRLTQRGLADRLEVASTTVNRLYQNKFDRVDVGTIEKICNFFGCEVGDLLVLREIESTPGQKGGTNA